MTEIDELTQINGFNQNEEAFAITFKVIAHLTIKNP